MDVGALGPGSSSLRGERPLKCASESPARGFFVILCWETESGGLFEGPWGG